MMFLALVMTWNQLAACERTVAQLERLEHAQKAKAVVTQQDKPRKPTARDVAQMCAAAVIGEGR